MLLFLFLRLGSVSIIIHNEVWSCISIFQVSSFSLPLLHLIIIDIGAGESYKKILSIITFPLVVSAVDFLIVGLGWVWSWDWGNFEEVFCTDFNVCFFINLENFYAVFWKSVEFVLTINYSSEKIRGFHINRKTRHFRKFRYLKEVLKIFL